MDCSIDGTIPPIVYEIDAGDGVCNTLTSSCNSFLVYGENFHESDMLTCHLQRVEVSVSNTMADCQCNLRNEPYCIVYLSIVNCPYRYIYFILF